MALEAKEGEEAALRAELDALDGEAVDPAALQRTIEEFDGVWDQLFPRERARLLSVLLDSVAFDARGSQVSFNFRQGGLQAIVGQSGKTA